MVNYNARETVTLHPNIVGMQFFVKRHACNLEEASECFSWAWPLCTRFEHSLSNERLLPLFVMSDCLMAGGWRAKCSAALYPVCPVGGH